MNPTSSLRFVTSAAMLSASVLSLAQTAARPSTTAHRTAATPTHAAEATPACSKLPDMSPKIPAVPAGSPCAKPLYTVVSTPGVTLGYVSPLEGPGLRETLGLESSSFSLDYVDTQIGTGALAAPHKWYSIHYTGYLVDGTKFDSSLDRGEPIVIPYGGHQVIPGWDTGFDGMRVGGKRRLFIPFQLAYGPNGKPPTIPARAELIFDVELVAQNDTKPEPKAPAAAKSLDNSGKPAPSTAPAPASSPATSPAAPPPTQNVTPAAPTAPKP